MSRAAGALRVTLGVLTYRRPQQLAALLPLLVRQAGELRAQGHSAVVLVVDNDPAGSGRPVVEELASPLVRYVVEATPGIAAARNRVLDEPGAAAVLVFIDDDERPHAGWLRALLETWERTGAAAVAGAVVSEFSGPLDRWISAGGFFSAGGCPRAARSRSRRRTTCCSTWRPCAPPASASTPRSGSAAAATRSSPGGWAPPGIRWSGATRPW